MATVYVDEVFLINTIVSILILLLTKKLIRLKSNALRIILGGIACSVYTILMLLPAFKICYSLPGRIAFAILVMLIAFKIPNLKTLLNSTITFFIATFALGGAVYGAVQLLHKCSPVPILILLISTALAYFLILFVSRCRQTALSKAKQILNATVCICGKEKTFPCLADTGNSLSSPLSQKPVTIVENKTIQDIMPNDFEQLKISYIPFKSVGKASGVMLTIRADYLKIGTHIEKNALIGIYNGSLSADKAYEGLINPILLEEVTQSENLCSKPEEYMQQIYE